MTKTHEIRKERTFFMLLSGVWVYMKKMLASTPLFCKKWVWEDNLPA